MSNIGIYKAGPKKVYFHENEEDHAGWSFEVIAIAKIFADHGDTVYFMSPTDYQDGEYSNLFLDNSFTRLDRIIVFNGKLPKDEEETLLSYLRKRTLRLDLIITDLALIPKTVSFDNIYTQSKRLQTYGAIQESAVYGRKFIDKEKSIDYYFGGTERNRLADFVEYVWRPNCTWYGKSAFFGKVNYIPFEKHLEELAKSKYTIIIADESYNKLGFLTTRYYESILLNVFCFVDRKYDPDFITVGEYDFARVSSYKEMIEKMKFLDSSPVVLKTFLELQRQKLTSDMFKGENIYNLLK